jgi:hypothetical protein
MNYPMIGEIVNRRERRGEPETKREGEREREKEKTMRHNKKRHLCCSCLQLSMVTHIYICISYSAAKEIKSCLKREQAGEEEGDYSAQHQHDLLPAPGHGRTLRRLLQNTLLKLQSVWRDLLSPGSQPYIV